MDSQPGSDGRPQHVPAHGSSFPLFDGGSSGKAPVYVQCKGFRCLAYRDAKGIWRYFLDDKELPEVIKVISD
jgi:hypothetical protein